jgi:protein-tyrosine phosphatase
VNRVVARAHPPGRKEQGSSRGLLRQVVRALRAMPDRLLHERRHFEVRERLSRMKRPQRLLVVCYGNICRSPYLEAVLQHSMPDVRVESAGIMGPGRPVPELGLAVSAQRGLDLSAYRSRPLIPAVVRNADLVVVMDAAQARYINSYFRIPYKRIVIAGDLDPVPSGGRAIIDPWGKSVDTFVSSYDRLDRCAAILVSSL